MRTVVKFLFWGIVVFLLLNYMFPAPTPGPSRSQSAKKETVTLAEVTAKSRDAFVTTAAFMRQEKNRLSATMGVTLYKLDRIINQLRVTLAQVPAEERPMLQRRLQEWESTRVNVAQLQSKLKPAENSTVENLKADWQNMEVNISGKLLRENRLASKP